MKEPLNPAQAKKVIQEILVGGEVVFSRHALSEMAKDDLATVDGVNILRGGVGTCRIREWLVALSRSEPENMGRSGIPL